MIPTGVIKHQVLAGASGGSNDTEKGQQIATKDTNKGFGLNNNN
jgi:hypothetical protein